jgi:hypothetical protein
MVTRGLFRSDLYTDNAHAGAAQAAGTCMALRGVVAHRVGGRGVFLSNHSDDFTGSGRIGFFVVSASTDSVDGGASGPIRGRRMCPPLCPTLITRPHIQPNAIQPGVQGTGRKVVAFGPSLIAAVPLKSRDPKRVVRVRFPPPAPIFRQFDALCVSVTWAVSATDCVCN